MDDARSLRASLRDRYGTEKGDEVYARMIAEGKGPFGPGGAYRHLHDDVARRNGGEPLGRGKPRSRGRKRG